MASASIVGAFRLGRDADRITTESGSFLSLSLAYNVYANGESSTQWIRATFGGSRADALEDKLVKGASIHAIIKDPRLVTFTGADKEKRTALEGRIIDIDYLGAPRPAEENSAPPAE